MPDSTAVPLSPSRDGWRRLRRNRAALVSLWFLVIVMVASALGPVFMAEEKKASSDTVFARPGQTAHLAIADPQDPTQSTGTRRVTFWLGSDDHGKDVL